MKGDERHPTFLRVNLGVAAMHAFSPSAAAFGASFESRLKNLRRLAWVIDVERPVVRRDHDRTECSPSTGGDVRAYEWGGELISAGDAVLAAISLYIVNEARLLGLPRHKLARMLANVGVETLAGAVPILGDLFDMGFKANLRNLAIVEQHFGVSLRRSV